METKTLPGTRVPEGAGPVIGMGLPPGPGHGPGWEEEARPVRRLIDEMAFLMDHGVAVPPDLARRIRGLSDGDEQALADLENELLACITPRGRFHPAAATFRVSGRCPSKAIVVRDWKQLERLWAEISSQRESHDD